MRALILAAALLTQPVLFPAVQAQDMPAEGPGLNFYVSYWPSEGLDNPVSSQALELGEDGVMGLYGDGMEDREQAATPADMAVLQAAVAAAVAAVTPAAVPDVAAPLVQVEWSVSNATTFARGSTSFALDALPPAVAAAQAHFFGAGFGG
ncbi:hypothetical protein GEU84_002505 [Fertoebacter nigrum]|uniref:Uncharacterized protein n=1 Tax=Fertoeibacter niger TaxID=2656921 RepID=A0A8X8GXG6_9RHOB|nr:hypothetical protein [Fertoeibacter niger]NUB43241.1 hypothetical protein [Fertoeibacter niger]